MASRNPRTRPLRKLLPIPVPGLDIILPRVAEQEKQKRELAKARVELAPASEIRQAPARAATAGTARDAAQPEKARAPPPVEEQARERAEEAAPERDLLRESQFRAGKAAAQGMLPPIRSSRRRPME